MQTKFSEDVVPLSDLKVVQGLAEYESLEEEVAFLKAVTQGLMEVREGKVTSLEDVKRKLGIDR